MKYVKQILCAATLFMGVASNVDAATASINVQESSYHQKGAVHSEQLLSSSVIAEGASRALHVQQSGQYILATLSEGLTDVARISTDLALMSGIIESETTAPVALEGAAAGYNGSILEAATLSMLGLGLVGLGSLRRDPRN